MKLTFFGAAHAVTGSCHCLEVGGRKILIDCGLQQGRDEHDGNALDFSPNYIDYVLVTHAHIDHSGRLPLLVKQGFNGRILTTGLTAELLSVMLRDSAHIQEGDANWHNQKGKRAGLPPVEPLYTLMDAEEAIQMLETVEYGWKIDLCDGVKVRFNDAGHLLGSSTVEIWATENGVTKKIRALENQWNAIAIDTDGTIYAIDQEMEDTGVSVNCKKSTLYKVDRNTGNMTPVGDTGLLPYYASSAVIDPRTGRMFWSVTPKDDSQSALYEVNKSTGACPLVYRYPGAEQFMGMYVPAPLAEDGAPAAPARDRCPPGCARRRR